jgi:hypothetical protein
MRFMSDVRTSRLRWWLIRGSVVGLMIAGLAAALVLALRAYAPALSRDRIEAALTDALGRTVKIESLTLSPWLARVEVRNVSVGAGPGEGGEPALHLGRGELRIGISSLWLR